VALADKPRSRVALVSRRRKAGLRPRQRKKGGLLRRTYLAGDSLRFLGALRGLGADHALASALPQMDESALAALVVAQPQGLYGLHHSPRGAGWPVSAVARMASAASRQMALGRPTGLPGLLARSRSAGANARNKAGSVALLSKPLLECGWRAPSLLEQQAARAHARRYCQTGTK